VVWKDVSRVYHLHHHHYRSFEVVAGMRLGRVKLERRIYFLVGDS
jgi:hypothetical protein